jgi:hypothetical protein
MNCLIKQRKEREAQKESEVQKFFKLAKLKLRNDIRDILMSDPFEWSSSGIPGTFIIHIYSKYASAFFDQQKDDWEYYISNLRVSEDYFFKYLKLKAFI